MLLQRAHRYFELLDDQQNQYGYDYSAYYQDPSAYGQQGGYDASSYNQQSYGSGGGYGSRDASGEGGRSYRHGQDHGGGYRDGGRDNDRYGDSRGSYSRRDNYQEQSSRNDEGNLIYLLVASGRVGTRANSA